MWWRGVGDEVEDDEECGCAGCFREEAAVEWWRMCSDDGDAKPVSLREFLEVERRFGDLAFFEVAAEELEGVVVVGVEEEPLSGS